MAMLQAPAKRPAKPEIIMALASFLTEPMPIIRDATDTKPSLAPRMAARSHCALCAKL
ncbi:hypothetical protein CASFOL_035816 [Castilleja foliolosa]|uniref:Uncharacterized protein n=1 Tax=Castilleja foliolosa TaxID=1961234 RepID=A0ABD3BUX7_9LAMI